ncbi:type II toxin-antitoxin system HicA family toxin [Azospirillum sp. 412522]|nr:type II toxin-antitoxin system HicA family toxin [Azospirillum sp. 412522]MBY6265543.1 type II toxin-antitoxin system HicA family toxin [Azospirillum sp. 412522]
MNDFGKAVREQLEAAGCRFLRHGKGDHDIWCSPHTNRPITVDHKIKSRHTANGIMKQAGLPHRF